MVHIKTPVLLAYFTTYLSILVSWFCSALLIYYYFSTFHHLHVAMEFQLVQKLVHSWFWKFVSSVTKDPQNVLTIKTFVHTLPKITFYALRPIIVIVEINVVRDNGKIQLARWKSFKQIITEVVLISQIYKSAWVLIL